MNMASGSGEPYVDFTAESHARFINLVHPDVVFLQELDRRTTRAGGVDQLAALTAATALTNSHFVKWQGIPGGDFGIAIISRFPLKNVQNRSVYKPRSWWPWFVVQIVTPVAYAEINLQGTTVHLYATHFPSNDEGRKKFGADAIAADIPTNLPMVFGGDFNDGPGGVAMAAIDAKFVTAESIAGSVVGQGGIDHFYVTRRGVECTTWTAVTATEQPRGLFSDHPIVYADLVVQPGVAVPNVIGQTAGAATTALGSAGFSVQQLSRVDHSCNAIGDVIGQTPEGFTVINAGSTVTIYVGERPDHPCP